VRVVRRVEPDRARHAAYQPFYEAYKDTYPAIADIVHRQTRLGRDQRITTLGGQPSD
jgi:hypothetical protein